MRIAVPRRVSDALLHANHHTCCWCHEARQPVEIHHINENPADNRVENLAVLCRNCHGRASTTGPHGRRLSGGEIKIAKAKWEAECERGEVDEPEFEDYEDGVVRADDHRRFDYSLCEGHFLVVGVTSDQPVDVFFGRESDYRRWARGDDAECGGREDVRTCTLEFPIESDNNYVVWIDNDGRVDANVEVDIAVWGDDDD